MENTGKIRIGIIYGGRSGEHAVSLMSARSVLNILDPEKYQVTQIGITQDGKWVYGEGLMEALVQQHTEHLTSVTLLPEPGNNVLYARKNSPAGMVLEPLTELDVIFPLLHGTFGEDGTLQGLLEMAGIAYVGSGVLGSSVGMDKGLFKDVMRANGVPVLESVILTREQIENHMQEALDLAETAAGYPLFIKPANLGSSVGVSKVRSRSDMLEGLMEAARFDRRVLVERGVDAREIEVSVLGNQEPQASIAGEIVPVDEFYTYKAKYFDDRSALLIPAPIDEATMERARSLACQAYAAADCAGLSRVDFLLDKKSGELFLNEINTIPGFTSISMYPRLWEASGLPYPALVDKLVELALERRADRDRTEFKYGSTL